MATLCNNNFFCYIASPFVLRFVTNCYIPSRCYIPYSIRAANFDLCSALMVVEQWGFFSVPHLLWHEASVYNGHLRGPLTLTPIAERLTVELKIPILTTYVCSDWDSNTQPSACRAYALTHCATAAVFFCSWTDLVVMKHLIDFDGNKQAFLDEYFPYSIKLMNMKMSTAGCVK